jgi:dUTP pyrophosphatase
MREVLVTKPHLLVNPIIRFKKTHPDAQLPKANNDDLNYGDTGYDLTAVEDVMIRSQGTAVVPVGLTLAYIEPGFWFRIEPRSGLGFKHSIQPHLGVIDNGYRGDLGVKLYNFGNDYRNMTLTNHQVKKGDRIAQLVVYQLIQPVCEWADEVEDSQRGDQGFGSTGK